MFQRDAGLQKYFRRFTTNFKNTVDYPTYELYQQRKSDERPEPELKEEEEKIDENLKDEVKKEEKEELKELLDNKLKEKTKKEVKSLNRNEEIINGKRE